MISAVLETQMGEAERNDLKIFAAEFGAHGELLPEFPLFGLDVLGGGGRMMADLLRDEFPAEVVGPVEFVGFAEERIERFGRPDGRRRVRGHGEGGDVGELLSRIRHIRRLV